MRMIHTVPNRVQSRETRLRAVDEAELPSGGGWSGLRARDCIPVEIRPVRSPEIGRGESPLPEIVSHPPTRATSPHIVGQGAVGGERLARVQAALFDAIRPDTVNSFELELEPLRAAGAVCHEEGFATAGQIVASVAARPRP
jgi:hypothetical protein